MASGHRAFEKVEMLSSRRQNDSSCLIGCLRTTRSSRLTVSGSMEPSMLRLILWSLSPRLKGERLIEFLLGCELIIGFERRKSYRETTVEKRVLVRHLTLVLQQFRLEVTSKDWAGWKGKSIRGGSQQQKWLCKTRWLCGKMQKG